MKNTVFFLARQKSTLALILGAFLLLSPFTVCADSLAYQVVFEGVQDSELLKIVKSHSQLIALKNRPPASLPALQYRAESDIPELIKNLHALGYYDAIIQVRLEEVYNEAPLVVVTIQLGPQYRIECFEVNFVDGFSEQSYCEPINDDTLNIHPGDPALSQTIIDAENRLKHLLSNCGFPLCKIFDRKIVVDGKTKKVSVSIQVDEGTFSRFGKLTISGHSHVKLPFIQRKIAWKEGDVFSESKVNATQKALLESGLFSSVIITHENSTTPGEHLPIHLELTESKYRSISIGASYQTHWGAGGNLSWENRNVGGMGSKLRLEADVTQRSQTGIASYHIPDFKILGQDLIWQAEASSESVLPSYSARAYSLLGRLDRRFSTPFSASIGLGGEKLFVDNSVQNGQFWLAFAPFYLRYNTTDSLLNPSKGFKTHYHAKPTINAEKGGRPFIYQEARLCTYWPMLKDKIILAQLFTLGSILSYKLGDVPVPSRIFGGTEENLRGYRFMSVSPLNGDNKPIGGRSGTFYSVELRFRLSKNFGLVPFFDMGRVSKVLVPNPFGKWLASAGLGFRYFTFFGPFRLDVGFPLEPRKGIDSNFRILASIGQTF